MVPAQHHRIVRVLAFLSLQAGSALFAQEPPVPASVPDYAIYRAVLAYLVPDSTIHPILIVDSVRRDSVPDPDAAWWRKYKRHERNFDLFPYANLAWRDSALLAPFIEANRAGLRLSLDGLGVNTPIVLVVSDHLSDSGWAEVRHAYPHASPIIRFSRVGFSHDGGRAVVDVSVICGPALCAERGYYFLKRSSVGTWRVVHYDYFFGS